MLKMINRNLVLVGASVLLFSACSSKEATMGEMMMNSATLVEKDVKLKKELSAQWAKGSKLVKTGKEQVEEGEDLIDDGEKNIKKGESLMKESESKFKEKFPNTLLKKWH
ncbi:MAG: Unknown protein [uncultured Sulfurovum sp.]|uniref:Lipoprotein n=1 Tax=uncultured Sulfurovum sp. TaxID=269237 RepID=A0A6S6T4D8_9BACT|nr:MAG: Unknown protein [uncultured Sulfurovum sp.]